MEKSFWSEIKVVFKVAKWQYFLKFFTSISIRAILLIIPILFSESINLVTNNDYNMAIVFLIITMAMAGLYRFFEGFNQVAYYKLYRKLFNYYNSLAVSKTNDNSLFSLSRFTPGQYTNIVITDVDIISGFFTASVIRIVQIIEFFVIYVYFFLLDINIFILTLVVSAIMFFIAVKSGNKVQVLNEKRKYCLDELTSSLYGYFGRIKEVKSFNIFDKVFPGIETKSNNYLNAHSKYNVKFNFNNHLVLFVFEVFRIISVIYGVFLVKNGNVPVGTLLLIYNYYQKIIDNFLTILTINVEYRNLKVSLLRFNKIVEYSKNKKDGIFVDKNFVEGKISFSNVLYGFRDNPMLDNVSFSIPAKSLVVLDVKDEAAQNGVYDLLLKLNRQHEGTVKIDDVDISEIDDRSYFSIISAVRRNHTFFDVSIKDNLLMINSDFDKVVDICKKIGIDDDIQSFDKGYDTILDDNLSISQSTKASLVIARTLLDESRILLFDDIINLLDDKTERKLINYLIELKNDHTILIVSRSKKFMEKADLVFEVASKKVLEVKQEK